MNIDVMRDRILTPEQIMKEGSCPVKRRPHSNKDFTEEEELIECLMCGSKTSSDYLRSHIRFNHLINKEFLVDRMYNMHHRLETSTHTQTSLTWIQQRRELEEEDEVQLEAEDPPAEVDEDDNDLGNNNERKIDEVEDESEGEDTKEDLEDETEEEGKNEEEEESRVEEDEREPEEAEYDTEDLVCHTCKDIDYEAPMIACESCDRWFHWSCVGVTSKPPDGDEWHCSACVKKPSQRQVKSVDFDLPEEETGGASGRSSANQSREEDCEIKVTAVVKPKRRQILERSEDSDQTPPESVSEGETGRQRILRRKRSSDEGNKKRFKRTRSNTHCSDKKNLSDEEKSPEDQESGSDYPKRERKRNEEKRVRRSIGDTRTEHRSLRLERRTEKVCIEIKEKYTQERTGKHRSRENKNTDKLDSRSNRSSHQKETSIIQETSRRKDRNVNSDKTETVQTKQKEKVTEKRAEMNIIRSQETSRDKRSEPSKQQGNPAVESTDRYKTHKKDRTGRRSAREKLVEVVEGDETCKLCGHGHDLPDELELGPLYRFGVCQAHLHCLMFSSGLVQGGEEDEGIVGFLRDDIIQEWRRGSKLKCCFCRELYATVGCCQKLCLKTYHLPCGIKHGALGEYYGNFDSYCPNHKHRRTRGKNYVLTDLGLVPETVDREAGDTTQVDNTGEDILPENPKRKKDKSMSKKVQVELAVTRKHKSNNSGTKNDHLILNKSKEKTKAHEKVKSFSGSEVKSKRRITKPKLLEDYITTGSSEVGETLRRTRRERKKVEPLSDIYKSAKEELEKILKSKYVSIEDTFEDLHGKRRRRISGGSEREQSRRSKTKKKTEKSSRKTVKQTKHPETSTVEAEETVCAEDIVKEESIADIEQFLNYNEGDGDQDPLKMETKSPEKSRNGYHSNSYNFVQNDGPNDNMDHHSVILHNEAVVEAVFPDLGYTDTSEEDEDIGISDIIENLEESDTLDPPQVLRYGCSSCPFRAELREHVDIHIVRRHKEIKVLLEKMSLTEEQLKLADQDMSVSWDRNCRYLRKLERFTFFSYVSDDMPETIGDFEPQGMETVNSFLEEEHETPTSNEGRAARRRKRKREGFISWDEISRRGELKQSHGVLNGVSPPSSRCSSNSRRHQKNQVTSDLSSTSHSERLTEKSEKKKQKPKVPKKKNQNKGFHERKNLTVSHEDEEAESSNISTSDSQNSFLKLYPKLSIRIGNYVCPTSTERNAGSPDPDSPSMAGGNTLELCPDKQDEGSVRKVSRGRSARQLSMLGLPSTEQVSPSSISTDSECSGRSKSQNTGGKNQTAGRSTKSPSGQTRTPCSKTHSPVKTQNPGGKTQSPGGTTGTSGSKIHSPSVKTESPCGKTQSPGGKTQTSGDITRTPSTSPSPMFDCLKCGTRFMMTKELVMNHLSRHKLSLSDYVSGFVLQNHSDSARTIVEWEKDFYVESMLKDVLSDPRGLLKCCDCAEYFASKDLLRTHLYECRTKQKDRETKPDPPKNFKIVYSTIGEYTNTRPTNQQDSEGEGTEERPYLVKFEDELGREHTWVDEYEENGRPALYVDGKGCGQVDREELELALEQDADIPVHWQRIILRPTGKSSRR